MKNGKFFFGNEPELKNKENNETEDSDELIEIIEFDKDLKSPSTPKSVKFCSFELTPKLLNPINSKDSHPTPTNADSNPTYYRFNVTKISKIPARLRLINITKPIRPQIWSGKRLTSKITQTHFNRLFRSAEIINKPFREMNPIRKNQTKKSEKGLRTADKERRSGQAGGRKGITIRNEWLKSGPLDAKAKEKKIRERAKSGMRSSAVGLGRNNGRKAKGGEMVKGRTKRSGRRKLSISNGGKDAANKKQSGAELNGVKKNKRKKNNKDKAIDMFLGLEEETEEFEKKEKERKKERAQEKKLKANVRRFKNKLLKNYGANIGKFMSKFEGNLRKSQEKTKGKYNNLSNNNKEEEDSEDEPDFDYSRGDKLIALEKDIAHRNSLNQSKSSSKGVKNHDDPSANTDIYKTEPVRGKEREEGKLRYTTSGNKTIKNGIHPGIKRGKTIGGRPKSVIGRGPKSATDANKNFGRKKSVNLGRKRKKPGFLKRSLGNFGEAKEKTSYLKGYRKHTKQFKKVDKGSIASDKKESKSAKKQQPKNQPKELETSNKEEANNNKKESKTQSTQPTQTPNSNIFKNEEEPKETSNLPNESTDIGENNSKPNDSIDQTPAFQRQNSERDVQNQTEDTQTAETKESKSSRKVTPKSQVLKGTVIRKGRPRSTNLKIDEKKAKSIRTRRRTGFTGHGSGIRGKTHSTFKSRKVGTSITPTNRSRMPFGGNKKKAISETHSMGSWSFTDLEKLGIRKHKNLVEFIKKKEGKLPPFMKARTVVKEFGVIKAFVVNTHKGCVRSGNEDRVSILLNAQKKFKVAERKMKNCAMFSVFDGHGGTDCSNYLKENLHNKVLERIRFQPDMDRSLKQIYNDLDDEYLKRAVKKNHNFAGSCANSLFVFDDELVVVNTGDSRTVGSYLNGKRVEAMSFDHKPGYYNEFARIIREGGQLYRVSSNLKTIENMFYTVTNYSDVLQLDEVEKTNKNLCFGPWRVKPGGLSVSR